MISVSITLCALCQRWLLVLSAAWPVSPLPSSSIHLLQRLLSKLINLSVFLSQTAGLLPLWGHRLCNSMWTYTQRRNAWMLYVMHLTLKVMHPFSGTKYLIGLIDIQKNTFSSSLCSCALDTHLNSKTTLSLCLYSFLSLKSFRLSREWKASRWASDLQRLYEGSLGSLHKSLPLLMAAHKGSGYKCLDFWPRHLNISPSCSKHTQILHNILTANQTWQLPHATSKINK